MRPAHALRLTTALAMFVLQLPPAWSGESPIVDVSKTSTATNVNQEQLSQLPTGRNFADLATLTPQVVATKEAPRDSTNWERLPGGQVAIDRSLDQLPVITSAYSGEYGHYATSGVVDAITKSGGNSYYADRYAHALNSREWPGESQGYGGTLIGLGRFGKQPGALVYTPGGAPQYSFDSSDLKKRKQNVIDYLDEMCDLMTGGDYTAGKMTVSDLNSGKVSSGKLTSSNTYRDAYSGIASAPRLINQIRTIPQLAPQTPSRPAYDYPLDYKFTPSLSFSLNAPYTADYGYVGGMLNDIKKGGGMQQLDPPAAPIRQDSGTVTDADVDRGMNRLNQAQRDALDQLGLTPRRPDAGGASNTTPTTPATPVSDGPAQPGGPGQVQQATDAPAESVLDDLGPGPTPPLHPNPEGTPTVDDKPDGGFVRTYPDGTKEYMSPNGHTFVRYADGASFERYPDGTAVDRAPDGSTTTRDKDGKVTGRTGPTVIDLDRKIHRAVDRQMQPRSQDKQRKEQKADSPKTQEKKATTDKQTSSKASMVKEQSAVLPASMTRRIAELPAGLTAAPRVTTASTTDTNGNTTTIARQPDGSVTRTVTDQRGKVLEQGPVTQPEPTRATPRDGVTRASATDEQDRTVTVEKQRDGTTTRTVTERNGAVLERGTVDAPEPTKVPPRTPGVTRASTTDANGNTTAIEKFPDGSSTLTVTDANGRVVQQGPLTAPPVTAAPPRDRTTSASTTDANGNTVTIERQPNGDTTRTVTGPDGKVISRGTVEQPEPTKVRPRDRVTSVSSRNPDGTTTTIAKQPDGSTVRTVTDRNGTVVERAPVEPPPVTKVPPRTPGATSASTTYPNGNTLTIERQPDGTVTRTVTDRDGRVIERGTVPPLEPTKPSKKEPAAPFVSTTDANGNTVMIQRQPNGTMTQTVTDPAGKVIHQGTIEPPPVTKVPPRQPGFTSASATTEDGRTISVVRQPDGTTTRTVTGPDGKVIEQTTTGGPAPTPQPEPQPIDPANPATFGLEFAESSGVMVGPGGRVELAPPLPKPPEKRQTDTLDFKESEGVSTPLIHDWTGSGSGWSAQPGHSTIPFQPSIGYEPWWDEYYKTSDHLPVKADFQAAPQVAPQQPSTGTGSAPAYGDTLLGSGSPHDGIPPGVTLVVPGIKPQYLDEFVAGAEYEVLEDLRVGLSGQYRRIGEVMDDLPANGGFIGSPGTFRGGFNYHVPGWMPYYGTNPRQPEAGFTSGDTNYSNLGTYKTGYRAPTLNELFRGADGVRYFSPTLGGYKQGFSYPPQTQPQQHTHHSTGGAGARPFQLPQYGVPQHWQPGQVIVLPWGCHPEDKEDFLDDLEDYWDGRPVTWAMAYGKEDLIFFGDQAEVAPNDPLYDVGEATRDKAESRHKAEVNRKSRGRPDMSMAAPPEAGRSDIAMRGPAQAQKKSELKASDQWGLRAAGFTPSSQPGSAWAVEAGETPNTVVAIIDSGLDLSHPDGPANLWTNPGEVPGNGQDDDGNGYVDDVHGWNFLEENHDLRDTRGHGTLVAGIIAAKRNNGQGIAGINPGARIMVLKVSDTTNQANSLNVYRALRYAAQHGARVINISLGQAGRSRIVQLAINYAHARGAVVVAAAGNQSSDVQDHTPANARRALTVAAYGMDGARSTISNGGANLAVSAPGLEIYSLHSKDAEWPGAVMERERLYRTATGTSFSAPIVAATASLILAKNPKLPSMVVEDMLINSAAPMDGDGWNPATGAGRLDAGRALVFDVSRLITILPEEVVVQREKKKVAAVELYGTVRGVFTTYQLDLGEGRSPSDWKPLGGPREDAASHELLCRIPAGELKGSKEWVVRITALGKSGQRRVAYVPVAL